MQQVFFNELSIASSPNRSSAIANLREFIDCLKAVSRKVDQMFLISSVSLNGQDLSPDFNYQQWRNLPENHDAHSFLVRRMSKAPSYDFATVINEDSEYYYGNSLAYGLAAAYADNGLAVSIPGSAELRSTPLSLRKNVVELGDNGMEDVASYEVQVSHAWCPDISAHSSWLEAKRSAQVDTSWVESATPLDIVEHCNRLVILPQAYTQLEGLEGRTRISAFEVLVLLQASAAGWSVSESKLPSWQTKVTPESVSRRNKGLVSFHETDGSKQEFSWHARYTPGAGRVHFRIDFDNEVLRVAYIGNKLE